MICAGRELSTAEIGRLADISGPQTSRVLAQLVELGIVERREVPPAVIYRAVEGNVVVGLLQQLCDVRNAVMAHAAATLGSITPAPSRLTIYGSVATGRASLGSDIDVLVIRPDGADDDDQWVETLGSWRRGLEKFAGMPVSMLEMSDADWASRDRSSTLWTSIDHDEFVLTETYMATAR
jgi:predicted nucleotidyltransferase